MKLINPGNSSFETLITGNCIYVDKTEYLYNLIQLQGGYFFLSRPRRFGKTLTISTLEAIFQGRKELFDGLYISKTDYDFKKHPIIHIDFGSCQEETKQEIKQWIKNRIKDIAEKYNIVLKFERSYTENLSELITKLSELNRVVVLIDEYDKLLSDNISSQEVEGIRDVLRGFFEVLKASSGMIRFLLITGVTKFSKVSIFSSMNNLEDISLNSKYATMLGYTQKELEYYFDEGVNEGSKTLSLSRDEYLNIIKNWYDGYRFAPNSETVYNPVSIGRFFKDGGNDFKSYWVDTGGQKLVYDVAKKIQFNIDEDIEKSFDLADLSSYDIVELVGERLTKKKYNSLLYQSGYLTIKSSSEEGDIVKFDFPNEEVRKAFSKILLPLYIGEENDFEGGYALTCLREGKIDEFINTVKSVFAFIPSDIKCKYESAYQIGFCCMMRSLGTAIRAEEPTNKGRIDAVLETRKYVYIIEFKVDSSAEGAIKQIQDKGYAEKYQAPEYKDKTIILLGINFDTSEHNITDYKAVTL